MDIKAPGNNGEENVQVQVKPKKIIKRPAAIDQPKARNEKRGGLLSNLIAVGITALVVGGGIYAWQSRVGQNKIEGARQQVQETKVSYEQRLEGVKNSLSTYEVENTELKKQAESLLSKLGILRKAKIDFSDADFGISFSYPAALGEMKLTLATSTAGAKLAGAWDATDKLSIGGTGADYTAAGTSSPLSIKETSGFAKERDAYYLLGPGGARLAVKPSQTIAILDGEAIMIDQKSFGGPATGTPATDIGGNVAVVLNLKTGPAKGLAIVNTDFGVLSVEEMVAMVKSIEIK